MIDPSSSEEEDDEEHHNHAPKGKAGRKGHGGGAGAAQMAAAAAPPPKSRGGEHPARLGSQEPTASLDVPQAAPPRWEFERKIGTFGEFLGAWDLELPNWHQFRT